MPEVQIKDGPLLSFPDSMSPDEIKSVIQKKFPQPGSSSPTTPTGLSSIASPSAPPEKPLSEQPGTLKGVGQHIVGGAISTVPEIGLQVGKAVLAVPALLGKISSGKADDTTQAGIDWIEDKQKKIAAYFESTYTAPDINFDLGPLGKIGVGSTIGGIIPFAAGGAISAASKAAKAADVAVPVYEAVVKAMGHGALFSAAYEVPNVIAAKTWKEAEERAKQAGVSITVSALMAGTFTGTAKGFSWAKEKMGKSPAERMAKAQVIAEEGGLPNTEPLGANQPAVTPVDEVHAEAFAQKVKEKAARLEDNIPKVESVDDKIEAMGPPVPKQLDKAARAEENLENLAADKNSPGMKLFGQQIKRAEKMIGVAKDPETKAMWEKELTGLKEAVERTNRKIADQLADKQVENAAKVPPAPPPDKSGRGAPTPPPEGPPDQRLPLEKTQQAIIEAGQEFAKLKDLAHQETEAAALDPMLNKLTKERVFRLKQLGEDVLAGTQRLLNDIQRAVNPIAMLGREARQAFVNFSGFRTEGAMLLDIMTKKLHEVLPEKLDREFVTLLRDPSGHMEVLKLPRSPKIDAALSVVDKFYDQLLKIGVEADIFAPNQAIKNFVNRIYSASDAKKIMQIIEAKPLDAKNKHSFRRMYETMEEAARKHNIVPATLDIGTLMADYGRSLMHTMASGQLIRDMVKIMGHDLMWTAEKPRDPRWRRIDDRLEAGYRETKLPDGKIQVERLYADEKVHKLLQAALDPSPLKGTRLGQIADLNTRYKSAMLMLDVYHLANLTYQRTALNLVARGERLLGKESAIVSFKDGLALFDPENPKFESLRMVVRNGLGLERGDWQKLMSLSVQDVKKVKATAVGQLWQNYGIPKFNEFMWEKYHKGLKAATAVAEFERLIKDPELTSKFTHDELARKAATFANNVYGGQSWSTHGRTAKFNAISRMILLAPDWFETRMNLAAGLGKIREGGEFKLTPEFKAASRYWTGYVAEMSMAAFLGNTILERAFPELKDHPMKKGWKGMTNVVLPIKDGSGHNLVIGLGGSYRYVFDAVNDLGQTLTNRESGLMRAALEFYTHRDWTGKQIAPSMLSKENFAHMVHPFHGTLVPLPLTLRLLDIEFNAAGVANTKTGIDVTKSLLRSFGTHPTTGYPMELRREAEFLKDRRDVVYHKMLVMSQSGKHAMAAQEARDYNDEVVKLMRECQKTYRGNEIAKRLEKLLIK